MNGDLPTTVRLALSQVQPIVEIDSARETVSAAQDCDLRGIILVTVFRERRESRPRAETRH